MERSEKVSIVAIFKVLKQGIKIGEHGNHKQRGKHTVAFAAPVQLNGVRGNMAVVVNLRNNQYKVHRILMPDGSNFIYNNINENAESTGSDILLEEKKKGPDIDSASNISIPDYAEKVNSETKLSRKSSTDTVTMSIGELQKRKANYESDRVYTTKEKPSDSDGFCFI